MASFSCKLLTYLAILYVCLCVYMFVRLLFVLFYNLELAINFEQMKLNIATVIFNCKQWLESHEFIICLLFIHNVFLLEQALLAILLPT